MKKIALFTFTVFTLVLLGACQSFSLTAFAFDTDEKVLSFSALTSTSLLSTIEGAQPMSAQSLTLFEDINPDEEMIDTIEPYLNMVEKFLADNQGFNVTTVTSDRPEYETMMVIETVDMLGGPTTYTIYYVSTPIEDDESDEELYSITGLLIMNDQEYTIEGKKEIEDDEEKISFKASIDELNYVESVYKVEDNENKFIISVFQNGELLSQSKIKVEVEDFELQIHMEFISGDNHSEFKFKYENEDGQDILKIKFESEIDGIYSEGNIRVLVTTDELTGETTYALYVKDDESEEEHEYYRDRKDDDDDESEGEEASEPDDSEAEESEDSEHEEPSEPEDSTEVENETEDTTYDDTTDNGDLNTGASN